MIAHRLKRFAAKPFDQKVLTLRFFVRRGLAKLPFVPITVRFRMSPAETISLWWSQVIPTFHADRDFLDYWGEDIDGLCFLWNILEPGMVFFDVGAYHGLYTLVAAQKVREQGHIVAFEPSPRERRRLRLHLRLNRLSRVDVEAYAVGLHSGTRKFFLVASADTSMNSLQPPAIQDALEEISVQTISLDEYCQRAGIGRVDLIKIDAEGGELEIFQGARQVLTAMRPLIICEVLDRVTLPWGYRAREIVAALASHRYAWFEFRPGGTLLPHAPRQDYPEVANYLAVPEEKLGLVQSRVRD